MHLFFELMIYDSFAAVAISLLACLHSLTTHVFARMLSRLFVKMGLNTQYVSFEMCCVCQCMYYIKTYFCQEIYQTFFFFFLISKTYLKESFYIVQTDILEDFWFNNTFSP